MTDSPTDKKIQEIGGITYAIASDLPIKSIRAARGPHSEIRAAVREQWPKSHADYQALVLWRFAHCYHGIPTADAIHAIRLGYSSPSAAMRAKVIKRRRYIGPRVRIAGR